MPTNQIPCILADFESFVGIVFFLIAFVGWVINLVNQNQDPTKQNKGPRRNQPQAGNRKQDVQGEIDQFLNQSRRRKGEPNRPGNDDIEVVSAPGQQRRPPRRRRTRQEVWEQQTGQQPQPLSQETTAPAVQPRPGEALASRHLASTSKKRKKSRKQLSQLNEKIQQDLPHSIDASVSTHLHTFSANSKQATGQIALSSTTRNYKTKGNIVGGLLRSKKNIRDAIILNEILSPPKSRRS